MLFLAGYLAMIVTKSGAPSKHMQLLSSDVSAFPAVVTGSCRNRVCNRQADDKEAYPRLTAESMLLLTADVIHAHIRMKVRSMPTLKLRLLSV